MIACARGRDFFFLLEDLDGVLIVSPSGKEHLFVEAGNDLRYFASEDAEKMWYSTVAFLLILI